MKNFDEEFKYLKERIVEVNGEGGLVAGLTLLDGCTIVDAYDTAKILLCLSRKEAKKKGYPDQPYYEALNQLVSCIKNGSYRDLRGHAPEYVLQEICPFN